MCLNYIIKTNIKEFIKNNHTTTIITTTELIGVNYNHYKSY